MTKLHVILAADIFGKSREFEALCQQINFPEIEDVSVQFHVLGPYQHPKNFASEQQAYQYFSENVGIACYSQYLLSIISAISGPKLLVGFSVGGSAMWQLMPKLACHQVLSVTCFYSSQIRHMTSLDATVSTTLVFPKSEQHFSVEKLIEMLEEKSLVDIEQSAYQHGFLNQLSNNYSEPEAQKYLKKMTSIIQDAIKTIV